jgi:ATP-dependent protease ClpP protease subunit
MPHADANSEGTSRKTTPSKRIAGVEAEPHAEFRPDPARSISVNGMITQDLVYSLTPAVIRLQHESRNPIAVYIDSPGGSVSVSHSLLRLLRSPGLDSSVPCRLITVVTGLAASAAATLLTSGDYAIAYPGTVIHFHGVRTYRQNPITVEEAADVARDLKASNEASAVSLARSRSRNFFFRFITLRSEFDGYRAKNPKAADKDCFVGMISGWLSRMGT